ncbi:MAG: CPXCG motif-containing cysteine-rich protein [Gammaproteobacteria bacterium]
MDILQNLPVQCPCCGESIEILVDTSIGEQEYVEDCQVCCEPMIITVTFPESGNVHVETRRENA